jgi:hypothetical protein
MAVPGMEERSASVRREEVEGSEAEAEGGGALDDVTRVGTRYSRAPSGDDWSRMGVSISIKSIGLKRGG